MANNAAGWRALTDVQRAGWEALGGMIERTDALGQTYTLNGFMAYCSVNNNKLDAGDSVVSTAPAIVTPGTLATATITLTSAAMSIAYTTTPLAADTRLFAYVSPQVSAGRQFNGDTRLIGVTATAAASPFDIFSAYEARLGTPVTANRIFFNLVLYNGGFKGAAFGLSQVIA